MNRNSFSFDNNPINIDISRSTFNRDSEVITTFNVGDIVPIYVDEVLPGDTFKVNTSKVVRMQTPITPFMGNIYLDTYYFYVPNRIIWEHWKQFQGENTESEWLPTTEYEVPLITAPAGGWAVGTIADYMGIPTGVANLSVNALPFRAYAEIINEWFRDQNLQDPLLIPKNDTTVVGVNSATFVSDVAKGGKPFIASKYRDYFTSCLPAPQKGQDVGIGISGQADVYGDGKSLAFSNGTSTYGLGLNASAYFQPYSTNVGKTAGTANSGTYGATNIAFGLATKAQGVDVGAYADLSTASAISINSLRLAFAVQKMYEKEARGGSRYIELIKAHFGVQSPDSRMQRPEYLGGNRVPISVNQVVQTSKTEASAPLGETAAYSLTQDYNGDFVKSFTEHGFVIGVMVARYDHIYQQGLERFWTRKDKLDYYLPVFANLGEMPVKNKEIYAKGTAADDEVFGYQEAWADYRYKPSRVTGEMRSTYATSLDVWHLGDDYASLPILSDGWIREDKSNVDRCISVTSAVSNQLFADILIENKCTRAMPIRSIPGLIDHH